MSHPVTVGPAEACLLDARARGGVGVAPVYPGRDRGEAGELCLETDRVELLQPLGDVSDGERPRAVGAVAVEERNRRRS